MRALLAIPAAALLLLGWSRQARAENQQTLGPGYQLVIIHTDEGGRTYLHSPALTYVTTVGGTWGLQGLLSVFFPAAGGQDGTPVSITDDYRSAWGVDAICGPARRVRLSRTFQVDLGAGPHLNADILTGKANYRDFTSVTLGLAANAALRWRPTGGLLSIGAYASGAVDFIDLLHGGDLAVGFGVSAGGLVGADFQ